MPAGLTVADTPVLASRVFIGFSDVADGGRRALQGVFQAMGAACSKTSITVTDDLAITVHVYTADGASAVIAAEPVPTDLTIAVGTALFDAALASPLEELVVVAALHASPDLPEPGVACPVTELAGKLANTATSDGMLLAAVRRLRVADAKSAAVVLANGRRGAGTRPAAKLIDLMAASYPNVVSESLAAKAKDVLATLEPASSKSSSSARAMYI